MISPNRIKRIKAQGYQCYTNYEIARFSFGNRFSFILCSVILAIGLLTKSKVILLAMLIIAFLGVILPRHPFDYIYNQWIAEKINKPKLPKRSPQIKFACGIATLLLIGIIYAFSKGLTTVGYVLGGILLVSATLVSVTDFCIPSFIFNTIMRKRQDRIVPK